MLGLSHDLIADIHYAAREDPCVQTAPVQKQREHLPSENLLDVAAGRTQARSLKEGLAYTESSLYEMIQCDAACSDIASMVRRRQYQLVITLERFECLLLE